MSFYNLHPQFIKPDGIGLSVDHQSFAPGTILPSQKFRVFCLRPLHHVVKNNPLSAFVPVAAGTDDLIEYRSRNGCVPGKKSRRPFLKTADLLVYGRILR